MIAAKITVHSEEVKAALAKFDNLVNQLAQPTGEALEYLRQKMAAYPPPPAGSTYVRTETLKNGWESYLVLAGDRLGLLENPTLYAPYVQGAETQAAVHRGRWQTIEQVAEDEAEAVIRFYDEYIQRLLNG